MGFLFLSCACVFIQKEKESCRRRRVLCYIFLFPAVYRSEKKTQDGAYL